LAKGMKRTRRMVDGRGVPKAAALAAKLKMILDAEGEGGGGCEVEGSN